MFHICVENNGLVLDMYFWEMNVKIKLDGQASKNNGKYYYNQDTADWWCGIQSNIAGKCFKRSAPRSSWIKKKGGFHLFEFTNNGGIY